MSALMEYIKRSVRRGRPRHEPHRETTPYPGLLGLFGPGKDTAKSRLVYKATPRNIRMFSKTPICRRAINQIKNPISMLDWEVVPIRGVEMNSELERQIEIATAGLENPNDDDTFMDLLVQVINDYCCGAGAIEIARSGDPMRPVWLWPVDGLTVQIYAGWTGSKNEARYYQTLGSSGLSMVEQQGIPLLNEDLIYMRPNISTDSPFGYGPVEVAFETIARALETGKFAGKLAANSVPGFMVDLGEVSSEVVHTFRRFWRNEVEGQGQIPIIGNEVDGSGQKTRGANVMRLYPEGDAALYLNYQEFLRTEIAAAFDISNMSLNLERDVNRSTAEVQLDRDWDNAIKPCAKVIAQHINRDVIQNGYGFSQLHFRWVGLDREDEEATSRIFKTYYEQDVLTPNEIRMKLGEPRSENPFADLTYTDREIAIQGARGAASIMDDNLPKARVPTPAAPPKPTNNQATRKAVRDANRTGPARR